MWSVIESRMKRSRWSSWAERRVGGSRAGASMGTGTAWLPHCYIKLKAVLLLSSLLCEQREFKALAGPSARECRTSYTTACAPEQQHATDPDPDAVRHHH